MATLKSKFRRLINWMPFVLTALFVLRSRPFLKIPYDSWHHLMLIRGWFANGAPYLTMPDQRWHEAYWHWMWAKTFAMLRIDDVFSWARIIHSSQFAWTLFCVGFLTYVVLGLVSKFESRRLHLYFSLFGAWLFVVGTGTFSVQYQQSWMLWYGVNYQGFTLPAYFLATALLLKFMVNLDSGVSVRWQYLIAALVLGFLIVLFHPLEFSYLILTALLMSFAFVRKVVVLMRSHVLIGGLLVLGALSFPVIYLVLVRAGLHLPVSFGLTLLGKPDVFWYQVNVIGERIQTQAMHRGLSSFNELAILGCAFTIVIAVMAWRRTCLFGETSEDKQNTLTWLALTTVFFGAAPHLKLLSGFLGLMTVDEQVWRFSLASPWFIAFPVFGAFVLTRLSWLRLVVAGLPVIGCLFFSRYYLGGPFNSNSASMLRSLELRDKDSVSVQYDRGALKRLDQSVLSVPEPRSGKKNLFLIRADLQSYIRASTGVYVLGKRLEPLSKELFAGLEDRYELVEITPPEDLQIDKDLRMYFPRLKL